MSARDPELVRRARQWAAYAEEDLLLARHGLTLASSSPWRLIAFHAQQCAEKYLKACLVLSPVISYVNGKIRRGGRGWRE